MVKKKVKIYGKAKFGHRENWKGKYRAVRRDSKGHFLTWRKWSPKEPIGKPEYKEIYVSYVDKTELKGQVRDEYEEYEWVEFNIESP